MNIAAPDVHIGSHSGKALDVLVNGTAQSSGRFGAVPWLLPCAVNLSIRKHFRRENSNACIVKNFSQTMVMKKPQLVVLHVVLIQPIKLVALLRRELMVPLLTPRPSLASCWQASSCRMCIVSLREGNNADRQCRAMRLPIV